MRADRYKIGNIEEFFNKIARWAFYRAIFFILIGLMFIHAALRLWSIGFFFYFFESVAVLDLCGSYLLKSHSLKSNGLGLIINTILRPIYGGLFIYLCVGYTFNTVFYIYFFGIGFILFLILIYGIPCFSLYTFLKIIINRQVILDYLRLEEDTESISEYVSAIDEFLDKVEDVELFLKTKLASDFEKIKYAWEFYKEGRISRKELIIHGLKVIGKKIVRKLI